MLNDINNLDTEDIGLKAIFGERFHDETAQKPVTMPKNQKPADITNQEKVAQKPVNKPTKHLETAKDAQWQPVKPDPNWIDTLKACAKWAGLFGSLNLLLFYWQQTGQMTSSAALPSMCVCCVLGGLGVGMNFAKGNR